MTDLVVSDLVRNFSMNLVSIVILAYVIYFRRYRRRDAAIGFVAFNVSLFTVAAALTASTVLNVGVGFGLFAVLSIVRLRSDESTQAEIGFTMVSLVIGLMMGLPSLTTEVKVVFSGLLLATMYIFDHPRLLVHQQYQRLRIELDRIVTDEAELRRLVEERVGGRVRQLVVQEIDFVRETMLLDVRLSTR